MNILLKQVSLLLLIAATSIGQMNALGVRRGAVVGVKSQASPVAKVNKATDTLDHILEQAKIIVQATGSMAHKTRTAAKAEINRLTKELDEKVADAIRDDLEIIKKTGKSAESKADAKKAYDRLVANVNDIRAQAKLVRTYAKAKKAVEMAPEDKKEMITAQAVQNINAAKEEVKQAGYISRAVSGVTSLVTTPVNYVFGEESSKTKTAFYASVGVATLAGVVYAGVPTMALAKAKVAYDAATLANLRQVSGATWERAKELGSSAWNAARTGLKYYTEAQNTIAAATMLVGVASSALSAANAYVEDNPGDENGYKIQNDAADAYDKALESLRVAKETEAAAAKVAQDAKEATEERMQMKEYGEYITENKND